jgi:hypothetical protein
MIWNWYIGSTRHDVLVELVKALDQKLSDILEHQGELMSVLSEIEAKVHYQTSVTDSVIALVSGLSEKIKAAGLDEAKLAEIAAELDANTDKLAAAVAANTPADPAPVEVPAEAPVEVPVEPSA